MNFNLGSQISKISKVLALVSLTAFSFNPAAHAATRVTYRLTITTCSALYSGTDSDVFFVDVVSVDDDRGFVGQVLLDKPGYNDFERNDVDSYDVISENFADLKGVVLRKDGTDDWCLNKIVIQNLNTGAKWESTSENRWFYTKTALFSGDEPSARQAYVIPVTRIQ